MPRTCCFHLRVWMRVNSAPHWPKPIIAGWHWLNAASLAAGRKFSHRRRERESDSVPAAALICLLLLPGIAFDSSRPAAAEIFLSRGTGFFVSKDGRLLTNFHVIDSCRQLTVQSGRQSGAARVVATDAPNDLALLATSLKPARIADWGLQARRQGGESNGTKNDRTAG